MTLNKMGNFSFNHTDQQDDLYHVQSALQIKQDFDSRANELKTTLNALIDSLTAITNGTSGADNIGATAIQDLTGTTVQAILKSLRDALKSVTNGSSGTEFINGAPITGVTGSTLYAQLSSLKGLIDAVYTKLQLNATTSGTSGSELVGSAPIAGVTGTTVYQQIANLKTQIDSLIAGVVPDGSISSQKLNFVPVKSTDKGVPNGVASLGSDGLVPASQLPAAQAIPDASTTVKGVVQLNTTTNSTSTTQAATPSAVKSAYDLANTANINATTVATTAQVGVVQLTNSVASTSTTTAATPSSVKSAYDLANGAIPSTQKGANNGVATLDGTGKVPTTQLPTMGSMTLIQSVTVNTNTSVMFTSIPQTYKELYIVVKGLIADGLNAQHSVTLQVNGLTSAYMNSLIYTTGSSAIGVNSGGVSAFAGYLVLATNYNGNGLSNLMKFNIPSYADTTNKKFIDAEYSWYNGAQNGFYIGRSSCNTTAGITSITFTDTTANFGTTMVFELYGIS